VVLFLVCQHILPQKHQKSSTTNNAQLESAKPTFYIALVDLQDIDENILDVRRHTNLLGNQLNYIYIGIQVKIKVAPSTATVLVPILPYLRHQAIATLGLQNNQLNLRRRNLELE